jgi:type IV pilus assembly protein PilV
MHIRSSQQTGISLIEVLVTLVLISLALLGTTALQVVSKRSNFEAVQRTTAAHLANDFLHRMRANRVALDTYLTRSRLGGGVMGNSPPKDCSAGAAGCLSVELARYDQWEWERKLDGAMEMDGNSTAGGLLEPTACISRTAGGVEGLYEVAIAWRGLTEGSNPTLHPCGSGTGLYGAANEFRHVIVMQTFINED